MIHERASEEVQEAAALYALGSLSQHESRAFEIHLREGCPICEAELRKAENVVSEIGLASWEIDPPAYVRDLLLARVEREGQRQVAAIPKPAEPLQPQAPRAPAPPMFSSVSAPAAKPRIVVPWIAAAACAVAAIVFLFEWRGAQQRIAQQHETANAAQGDAGQLRAMLELERSRTRDLDQIKAALVSPGVRFIPLVGQPPASAASGAIIWNTQKSRWIVSSYLPPAPAGMAYQLWFLTPTSKISGGVIHADMSGHSFTTAEVPQDIARLMSVAITLEPDGGSPQPTTHSYLLGLIKEIR